MTANAGADHSPMLAVLAANGDVAVEKLTGTWTDLGMEDVESVRRARDQGDRFRRLVRRRISELDGVAAAIAIVMDSEWANAVERVRETWLGAAGTDARTDHGDRL